MESGTAISPAFNVLCVITDSQTARGYPLSQALQLTNNTYTSEQLVFKSRVSVPTVYPLLFNYD